MQKIKTYPLIIRTEHGFCVHSPELRVSAEASTLEQAYQNYESQKAQIEERWQKYGLATITSEPFLSREKKFDFFHEALRFFMKAILVSLAFVVAVVLLSPNISAAINNGIRQLGQGFTCTISKDEHH